MRNIITIKSESDALQLLCHSDHSAFLGNFVVIFDLWLNFDKVFDKVGKPALAHSSALLLG